MALIAAAIIAGAYAYFFGGDKSEEYCARAEQSVPALFLCDVIRPSAD